MRLFFYNFSTCLRYVDLNSFLYLSAGKVINWVIKLQIPIADSLEIHTQSTGQGGLAVLALSFNSLSEEMGTELFYGSSFPWESCQDELVMLRTRLSRDIETLSSPQAQEEPSSELLLQIWSPAASTARTMPHFPQGTGPSLMGPLHPCTLSLTFSIYRHRQKNANISLITVIITATIKLSVHIHCN